MESGVHLPNSLVDLAFSSLLSFPPLVFSPLLGIVTSIFKYLIHEHCGLSVWPLHLPYLFFSIIPFLTSIFNLTWSWLTLLLSLRFSGQGYLLFFTIDFCHHVHVSYCSQLRFPSLSFGSPLTPLLLSLWLWFWEDLALVNAIQLSPPCLHLSNRTLLEKNNWANWCHVKIRATNLKWALIYLVFLLRFPTGGMLSFSSSYFTLSLSPWNSFLLVRS